jgi:hypothetical protein
MNQIYLDTARLLTQVAPLVIADGTFALKGGTAINLFIRWKLQNLGQLELKNPKKFAEQAEALAKRLG